MQSADVKFEADPRAVVSFWKAAGPGRWFRNDPLFDALVRRKLGRLHMLAAAGMLDHWADTPEGALALILLLDQAPRNMSRGTPRGFATDPKAREVARFALSHGDDRRVPKMLRSFFYLPFEHSEDQSDQDLCIELYREAGDTDGLHWADLHRDIIRRFGRFPHRNPILGRDSTAEEERYLAEGGFAG